MGRRQREALPPRPLVETELRVRYAETDAMGIVHHTSYLVWFEVGRTEYTRTMGYRTARLSGTACGSSWWKPAADSTAPLAMTTSSWFGRRFGRSTTPD